MQPFHLAIPVNDLAKARDFYTEILGCVEGRSDETWIDFNLYGHQLVTHLVPDYTAPKWYNPVDQHEVPIPHFGVILSMENWKLLSEQISSCEITFIIEPYIRFKGQTGEQATMFFLDPSGNALEFKAFANIEKLFMK
jgi:extradiol dioxygenase family protein